MLLDFGETLVEQISDETHPLSRMGPKPFPDTLGTLEELRAAGYLLAVVSNTTRSDDREMERALGVIGARRYVDVVVTSFQVGHRKPDPAIFTIALQRLGCSPNEAVMIGDDLTTDIAGGVAVGMTTVFIQRTDRPRAASGVTPTHRVASLREVPPLLNEIRGT